MLIEDTMRVSMKDLVHAVVESSDNLIFDSESAAQLSYLKTWLIMTLLQVCMQN